MITEKNIDEYQCFVETKQWVKLTLAEKIELVALCRMSGEDIGQHLSEEEEDLYYKSVVEE